MRALFAISLSALALAQTPEELRALEAAIAADQEAPVVAKSPPKPGGFLDMSLILDVAGAWFSQEGEQLGAHDPQDTGLTFQQLEWHVGANVDHLLRFESNIVFARFGVEVEEAHVRTRSLPGGLQLRGGQFLIPFGRLNPSHPHSWDFLDQALVNGKFFGGEGSRGLGVELSWLTPLPWYVELTGAANHADGACCARSYYGSSAPRIERIGDLLYTAALRQFFDLSPSWGLKWGLTGQFGPNDSGQDARTEIYGSDVYLRWRDPASTTRTAVTLQVEVNHRRRQQPGTVLADTGGYAQLVWRIDPEWAIGTRYGMVEGLEADPLDPDWDEGRQRVSIQVTHYPSHFSRLRLQGTYDDPPWLDTPIYAAMLGLEVLVGSHGAHSY